MTARIGIGLSMLVLLVSSTADAYPEFEVFVEQRSGRWIDCAMCHSHPDGPEGVKPGQIRSLSPAELERLNQARRAFEPGSTVDSPILNAFGDRILHVVGKRRFLEMRVGDPGDLAEALAFEHDLDGDGVTDAREYLDGTDPLDPHHADPWRLLKHRLAEHWFDVVMILVATVLGMWGINHLLTWFSGRAAGEKEELRRVGR